MHILNIIPGMHKSSLLRREQINQKRPYVATVCRYLLISDYQMQSN